jgi:putative transposase
LVHFAALNAPYGFGLGREAFAMPEYRRRFMPGGEYFFTVNLADRSSDVLVANIDALRSAWSYTQRRMPFETLAAVVLPDHLHCIWRLPPLDDDFPNRWRLLKAHFTRSLVNLGAAGAGRRSGERDVWQRRFWEHAIRNERDFVAHVDYVHNNPVKHGHCARVDEWPYSTWARWNPSPDKIPAL